MADFGARSDDGFDRAMGRVHESLVGGFEGYWSWVEYVISFFLLYLRMETDLESIIPPCSTKMVLPVPLLPLHPRR